MSMPLSSQVVFASSSPFDFIENTLTEFAKNVTSQDDIEESMDLIRKQIENPFAENLFGEIVSPGNSTSKKQRRKKRSYGPNKTAPMILVPETTDRECIKTNTLSSVGFLAFVTSVINAVMQAANNINNNNNNRNNNDNDNNQNSNNVNVANLASMQMNMNMVMVGRRRQLPNGERRKKSENDFLETIRTKLPLPMFGRETGNETSLRVEFDEEIRNHVLETLDKIPSSGKNAGRPPTNSLARNFWYFVNKASNVSKHLLGLRRKRDLKSDCRSQENGIIYDVSLLGISFIDLWMKINSEDSSQCLARSVCEHSSLWTLQRSEMISQLEKLMTHGLSYYLLSARNISPQAVEDASEVGRSGHSCDEAFPDCQ